MKLEFSASNTCRVTMSPSCSRALSSTIFTRRSSRLALWAISEKSCTALHQVLGVLAQQLVEALLLGQEEPDDAVAPCSLDAPSDVKSGYDFSVTPA